MNTKAVRIHGKNDLRLEEITLPEVGPDDVQIRVICDSICMSTYKAALEGEEHKRVPNDVAEHPTIGMILDIHRDALVDGAGTVYKPVTTAEPSTMVLRVRVTTL